MMRHCMPRFSFVIAFALAGAWLAPPAGAQEKLRIGFISTFTGPNAQVGEDMRNAAELALDHLGRSMAGRPVQVIYEDDQQKPEVGKQKAEKLVQSDKVHFVTGVIWSNVLLAALKPVVDSETFLVSANAGASQVAGELCSPWFFSTSWQNDQTPMALGETLNQRGVKSIYIIAPNYSGGRDMVEGMKRTFKGKVLGEDLTRWPDQLDFSAELSKARAAKPDAIYVFYPGAAGAQFLSQYSQAGLKGQIPLYSVFTVDALSLPQQKDLALGVLGTQHWVHDLPNDANRRFVADYRRRHGRPPSFYGAQSYDAVMLIDSAVRAVKGDTADKAGMRAAMRRADYASVRGKYRYGNNHFPIQNFYLQEAVKDADGAYTLKTVATVLTDHQDTYHQKCPMTW
jgi:branched-chain amino acid transport system substrate-binding protein